MLLRRNAVIILNKGWREFGEPSLCLACTWLGVVSSLALPTTLLLLLFSSSLISTGVMLSPLATFVVTVRVFDARAWRRWQSSQRTLIVVRIVRAYNDGILWLRWWARC